MKIAISFLLFILFNSFTYSQDTIKKEKKNPLLTNKFIFNVGAYASSKNVRIIIDGSGPNDFINFNKAFGLNDNEITFFGNFYWRFAKKWSLSSEFFKIRNGNTWALEEDIHWGDVTFKEGSNVNISFGINMYRIFVGRTLLERQKHELGFGLGVHDLQIGASIEGDAYINDSEFNFEKKSIDANAPLPNIGVWYFYAPTPKWGLTAKIDWFGITIGDYFGSLWNVAPGVNYQVFKHFGVGLSYRYFDFTAKVNKTNWNGKFNMIFQGPLLSISGTF